MKLKLLDYEVNIYDISFGQIEDLIDAVDLDHLEFKNRDDLAKCIKDILPKVFYKVCPIILSIFNMDEDELNTVTVDELVDVIIMIILCALNELKQCASTNQSKTGNSDVPLYQILFELQLSLCDRFSSLTPFILRHERASDVFLLVRRLNCCQNHSNETTKSSNNDTIRRPAQDDSWF